MKACFNACAEHDMRLLPFSPCYEKDNLEIRAAAYNSGAYGSITFEFYLDDEKIGESTVAAESGSYAFAKAQKEMAGLAGEHTVTVKMSSKDGEVINACMTKPLTVLKEKKPLLDGGFIMIGPPNDREFCMDYKDDLKNMTDDDWRRYISAMYKYGQKVIIINVACQYLTIESREIVAHYPSKLHKKSDIKAYDPIEAIFSEADKNGMEIFLGIGNNYGHMGTPDEVDELLLRYNNHKSFYGWYLAYEHPCDDDFTADAYKEQMKLARHIIKVDPVKPIMLSPHGMPADWVLDVFANTPEIDIFMPQDCVGQSRLDIKGSREMHEKMYKMCKSSHKHLWANCESFNINFDVKRLWPRYKNGGMDGEEGFVQQIETVTPYVEKTLNFMFTGFFTPPDFEPKIGCDLAIKQYNEYKAYADKINK